MSDDTKNNPNLEIDMSYLSDIASGSTEFMIDMIDIFIEQTPIYIDQLESEIKSKNWKEVADIAHKIKPTLAFMGVASARDDMEIIESSARSLTNVEDIEAKFNELKVICSYLFSRLDEIRRELQEKL